MELLWVIYRIYGGSYRHTQPNGQKVHTLHSHVPVPVPALLSGHQWRAMRRRVSGTQRSGKQFGSGGKLTLSCLEIYLTSVVWTCHNPFFVNNPETCFSELAKVNSAKLIKMRGILFNLLLKYKRLSILECIVQISIIDKKCQLSLIVQ